MKLSSPKNFAKLSSIVLVLTIFSANSSYGVPGLPPAGNVSCSLTDDGVNFGISMTFTDSIAITDWSYDWVYRKLVSGSPSYVSSYGPPTFFRNTTANGLRVSYSELLQLAGGDTQATLIVFAGVKNGTITNATGSGCYFDLPSVSANVKEASANANKEALLDLEQTNTCLKEVLDATTRVEALSIKLGQTESEVEQLSSSVDAAIAQIKVNIAMLTDLVLKLQKKAKS